MICGIAFDLEGTIIDIEWAHWEGHLTAVKEAGLCLTLQQAVKDIPHFVGGPDELIAKELAERCDSNITPEDLLARSNYVFKELLYSIKEIQPRQGYLELLKNAIKIKLPIAVGSLTDQVLATYLIHKSKLDIYFHNNNTVLKEDVVNLKPSPDVYNRTAEKMGISPSEQLVFEDSFNGVKAAIRAGSKVVAVPIIKTIAFRHKLIRAGASAIFYDWNGINIFNLLRSLNEIEKRRK
ncbi:MAG: HAD family phosphatase [Chloroflexota bacterium]